MNTRWFFGALVGGLIIFIWQFLSWAMLNLHASNQKYTPNQDSILSCLNANLIEDGTYFMPNVAPGTSQEDQQKMMGSSVGKPWALVSYHKEMKMSMSMNMIRGYVADVVAVLILCWVFSLMHSVNIKSAVLTCVSIGLIGYLTTEYSNTIWFENNSIPDLIDAIVSWALCGIWLGFWLKK